MKITHQRVRGSSVLAALVLVGLLGVIATVVQYTSPSVAYRESNLATANCTQGQPGSDGASSNGGIGGKGGAGGSADCTPTSPTATQPPPLECVPDPTNKNKQVCKCVQGLEETRENPVTKDQNGRINFSAAKDRCLPGCMYKIKPFSNGLNISIVPRPSNTDPEKTVSDPIPSNIKTRNDLLKFYEANPDMKTCAYQDCTGSNQNKSQCPVIQFKGVDFGKNNNNGGTQPMPPATEEQKKQEQQQIQALADKIAAGKISPDEIKKARDAGVNMESLNDALLGKFDDKGNPVDKNQAANVQKGLQQLADFTQQPCPSGMKNDGPSCVPDPVALNRDLRTDDGINRTSPCADGSQPVDFMCRDGTIRRDANKWHNIPSGGYQRQGGQSCQGGMGVINPSTGQCRWNGNTFDGQPQGGGMGGGRQGGGQQGGGSGGGMPGGGMGGGQGGQQQPQQQQCYPLGYQCRGNGQSAALYNVYSCQQQPPQLIQQCQYGCQGAASGFGGGFDAGLGGSSGGGSQCAVRPPSPYGNGTDGQPCYQPPQQPQGQQCTNGAWQQTQAPNGCINGWKCVPNGTGGTGTTVRAELSCNPTSADIGGTVTITYGCVNATGNTNAKSAGFENQGKLSGTASITLTPAVVQQGAIAANYGFTCMTPATQTNQESVSGAQCSVQINYPSITLVANPSKLRSGETSNIAWVTTGMKECIISSPTLAGDFNQRNANFKNPNGVATTPPLMTTTQFGLSCQTLGGATKTAIIVVVVE